MGVKGFEFIVQVDEDADGGANYTANQREGASPPLARS
jgi:hypothetical protein